MRVPCVVFLGSWLVACGGPPADPAAPEAAAAEEAPSAAAEEAPPAPDTPAAPAAATAEEAIAADWSEGRAVSAEDLVAMCSVRLEVLADAEGEAPVEGFTADGKLAYSSGSGMMEERLEGTWTLEGGTLSVTARKQVINGNGDTLSDTDASVTYTGVKRYGELLAGQRDGKWFATRDCGSEGWQESSQLQWSASVVQVIDATGGVEQVQAAVRALTGAGAVVLPGAAARNPRTGAQILTRDEGDQSALKAALEGAGISPVEVKAWPESPAPIVVAVGPNGS